MPSINSLREATYGKSQLDGARGVFPRSPTGVSSGRHGSRCSLLKIGHQIRSHLLFGLGQVPGVINGPLLPGEVAAMEIVLQVIGDLAKEPFAALDDRGQAAVATGHPLPGHIERTGDEDRGM